MPLIPARLARSKPVFRHALAMLGALGITLITCPADAQTCHALTGHWVLIPAKSHLGAGLSFNPYYSVSQAALILDQTSHGLTQEWHLTGPHLDENDRYTTPFDGHLAETGVQSALNAVPLAVKGEWQNCTLIEQGRANLFGQEIWTTSTFVISPDNQRLTILQSSHSDLGDVERSLVFARLAQATKGNRP
jgi:hypothetical protein